MEDDRIRRIDVRSPYLVEVIRAHEEYVVVRNSGNDEARIHVSVLRDNGLNAQGQWVNLPKSIYEHYFGRRRISIVRKQEIEDVRLFNQHIRLLMENERVITRRPELSWCCSPAWSIGGYPVGRATLFTLGFLFELWRDALFQTSCPKCGGAGYAYRIGGSFLSGRCSVTAVCPACGSSFATACHSPERSLGKLKQRVNELGSEVSTSTSPGAAGGRSRRIYVIPDSHNDTHGSLSLRDVVRELSGGQIQE